MPDDTGAQAKAVPAPLPQAPPGHPPRPAGGLGLVDETEASGTPVPRRRPREPAPGR